MADDAVHLLSELCANAVLHTDSGKTGGTFTVRAEHVPNAYLYGEVQDAGSDWHGQLPASATHAHGLDLLQMLSSACGVHRSIVLTSSGSASTTRTDQPRTQHPAASHNAAQVLSPHAARQEDTP